MQSNRCDELEKRYWGSGGGGRDLGGGRGRGGEGKEGDNGNKSVQV
jgi:hypothetical protein